MTKGMNWLDVFATLSLCTIIAWAGLACLADALKPAEAPEAPRRSEVRVDARG